MDNDETIRRTLRLPWCADRRLVEIAERRSIHINDAMRLAIGLLDTAERAREKGEYLGTSPDRQALTTVIVTPI